MRDIVEQWEMVAAEGGEETQIIPGIEAWNVSIYSACDVLAEEKSTDEV